MLDLVGQLQAERESFSRAGRRLADILNCAQSTLYSFFEKTSIRRRWNVRRMRKIKHQLILNRDGDDTQPLGD